MTRPYLVITLVVLIAVSAIPLISYSDASESDPDGFGYRYVDSEDPEPKLEYDYIDIRNDPEVIGWDTSNWESLIQANLGFSFNYYGNTYSKIYVSTYCSMSFVESTPSAYRNYYSKDMPSNEDPQGLMAVYFRYYNCYSTSKDSLYTLQTQIDGEKVFIVEWNPQQGGQFQALLYEGGMIKYQYASVPGGTTGYYVTIGIENPAGTTGTVLVNYEYQSSDLFTLPYAIAFVRDEIEIKDISLKNGDGRWGDTIFAGSKSYNFEVEAKHSRGAKEMLSVLLTLGSNTGQENLRFIYFHRNNTFSQLSGMDHARIVFEDCIFNTAGDYLTVVFGVDILMNYPSQDPRNVTAKVSGRSAVPDIYDAGELYWVETEVEWNPDNLIAYRVSDGRSLPDSSYVAGGESIGFGGFKVTYQDSEIQPSPSIFHVKITDNYGTLKKAFIQQGLGLDVTWRSIEESTKMTWTFEMVGFPEFSMLSEPFQFSLNVDIDPPDAVTEMFILPDSETSPPMNYDNDGTVFVNWKQGEDGGSGMGEYIIRAEKPSEGFQIEKRVSSSTNITRIGEDLGKELPEGVVNVSVLPVDYVGNVGPAIWTDVVIDLTGPRFELIDPSQGEWALSTTPEVKVRMMDDLTGIQGESVEYRISTDGGYTFGEWTSFYYFGSDNDIVRTVEPVLHEGRENIMEIKGTDVAGSEEITSDQIPIWVDARAPTISMSEPLTDENGTTVNWLRDNSEPLRIKIHDWKGSGIDPSTMRYRFSTDNGESFSTEIPLQGEGYNNSQGYFEYSFSIRQEWKQGTGNILFVEAEDLIGRKVNATFRIRLDMVPEIQLVSPNALMELWDNSSVPLRLDVKDPDGSDDITVTWFSNIDGTVATGTEADVFLSPGKHIILVTVEDGVHTVKETYSFEVFASILEDPRFKDSDGDGMNDSYEKSYGLNPLADDSDRDLDGDGHTNLEEYLAGTDPTDKGHYPGSEIMEEKFPIIPLLLVVLSIILLGVAGVLLAREVTKNRERYSSPPMMGAPLPQTDLPPSGTTRRQDQYLPPPQMPVR